MNIHEELVFMDSRRRGSLWFEIMQESYAVSGGMAPRDVGTNVGTTHRIQIRLKSTIRRWVIALLRLLHRILRIDLDILN